MGPRSVSSVAIRGVNARTRKSGGDVRVYIEVKLPSTTWYPGGQSLYGFTQLHPINHMLVAALGAGMEARIHSVVADDDEFTGLGPPRDPAS